MNIGFDAKRFFHNKAGLGNYARKNISLLSHFYPGHKYFLYNPKKGKVNYNIPANAQEILPEGLLSTALSSSWRQKGIVKQLQKNRIDLYHGLSNELPYGIEKTGIKSVVTIHDLIFKRYPEYYNSIDRKIYDKKSRHAVEVADSVIAISEQTKQDLITYYNVDKRKIQVVYQSCDNVYKTPIDLDILERIKQKFNLPQRFILNVGTIENRKNILPVIEALSELENEHLVIVGNPKKDYFSQVKFKIEKLRLSDRVHILSGVGNQELAGLYQLAEIFIYPSKFEGFGIPIIEALYSNTPVIAATGSCLEEAGGPNSIYCNPNDTMAFKDAMAEILKNKELKQNMIARGAEYVKKFDDQTIADSLMNCYLRTFAHA